MAPTFIVLEMVDAAGQHARYRQRIPDLTNSTAVVTEAGNLVNALDALIQGAIVRAYTEIPFDLTPGTVDPISDVRMNWKMAGLDSVNGGVDHIGIPARDPAASLLLGGRGILADLSDAAWQALLTLWNDNTNAMYLLDQKSGNHFAVDQGFAQVRARVRPRVGSRR